MVLLTLLFLLLLCLAAEAEKDDDEQNPKRSKDGSQYNISNSGSIAILDNSIARATLPTGETLPCISIDVKIIFTKLTVTV